MNERDREILLANAYATFYSKNSTKAAAIYYGQTLYNEMVRMHNRLRLAEPLIGSVENIIDEYKGNLRD